MANIKLKYNPYLKEVQEFTINNKNYDVEKFGAVKNKELGEWASEFLKKIISRCNDEEYSFDFTGIERDFNFLEDEAKACMEKDRRLTINLYPSKITTPEQKSKELKSLFYEMQKTSPFAELKTPELKELFNKAISSEFELAVVATMSSGKSTLINAMLGRDLLPARNEATTANLARIHDIDGQTEFEAIAFNKDNKKIKAAKPATQKDLENFNNLGNDPKSPNYVSSIEIYGDILGIDSSNMQLVLTDTPGPNNSQNKKHKEHTRSLFKQEYKPMILYVLNATQLKTDDDNSLLRYVSEAMAEGGRQSQDRFIFVLNKADEFDPEKGEDVETMIERANEYLKGHGIQGAKIFPCDSRSAKVFRQYLNKQKMTETEEDDVLPNHKKIVKREWRHFSDLAPLSLANRKILNAMLEKAEDEGGETGSIKQALIYTGVPAIELAISEYLSKYALPAKLTKGVDSFKLKIDKLSLEAKTLKSLAKNKQNIEQTKENLEKVSCLLSSGKLGKEMAEELKKLDLESKISKEYTKLRSNFMTTFRQKIDDMSDDSIDMARAKENVKEINSILNEKQVNFKVDIDTTIRKEIGGVVSAHVEKFNSMIAGLLEDTENFSLSSTLALLGDVSSVSVDETLNAYEKTESRYDRTIYVENENKRWYKPWTWWDDWGHYEKVYKNVTRIDFSNFIKNEVLPEVIQFLDDIQNLTDGYAQREQNCFREFFEKQINEIEQKIRAKLKEQEKLFSNEEKLKKQIEKNQENLTWLDSLKKNLDNILAI